MPTRGIYQEPALLTSRVIVSWDIGGSRPKNSANQIFNPKRAVHSGRIQGDKVWKFGGSRLLDDRMSCAPLSEFGLSELSIFFLRLDSLCV
jgi:hypothetical protein